MKSSSVSGHGDRRYPGRPRDTTLLDLSEGEPGSCVRQRPARAIAVLTHPSHRASLIVARVHGSDAATSAGRDQWRVPNPGMPRSPHIPGRFSAELGERPRAPCERFASNRCAIDLTAALHVPVESARLGRTVRRHVAAHAPRWMSESRLPPGMPRAAATGNTADRIPHDGGSSRLRRSGEHESTLMMVSSCRYALRPRCGVWMGIAFDSC